MNPLRVVVIGTRRQGQRLLAAWQNCPLTKIVGVVSASEANARAAAEQYGVERWDTDWRRVVNRPDVDIVNICSPTNTHAEIAEFAAEHGKHILSEKPIALDLVSARRAIAAAKRNGVIYGLGYLVRLARNFSKQRELIQAGVLGSPLFFRSWWMREAVPQRPAFHDETQNGDPFLDYFCHDYDVWQQCTGTRIVRATAVRRTWAEQLPEVAASVRSIAADTGCALLEFENGHIAECACGFALQPGMATPSVGNEVLGPKGALVGGPRFDLRLTTVGPDGKKREQVFENDRREEWDRRQVESFARSALDGKPPFAPAEEGLSAIHIWNAIRRAAAETRSVDVVG